MEPLDRLENLASSLETVASNGFQATTADNGQKDSSPAEILRMKEQMSNQCFEMAVKLQAGKSKRSSCSASDAEKDLLDYANTLEEAKIIHFNKTLALHRMQVWHAISEKLKQSDPEAVAMRGLTSCSLDLCSKIKTLQQESCELQDQITDVKKQRLDLKRLTHEKMKEMDELKRKREHPEAEKYRNVLQKGQSHLEKYQKMATITQNVLRGIIIASKVNWRDDPKLRDIAMTLEDIPISEE
ncbi:centromere protein H [Salvelinus namaycush]|uniref:Centromere protein H n=1 Tax=Salvelinus namaycush TaxID=8040 RepID=A0A8U1H2Q6_SALNM|nr:centromere protein H [Salvelinus namaycush]XP_038869565.1 centromere protein H [Salvelinus namaycush]XP_038869566.1 centromere protein H [Salvelinus namaycush]XP_038869567.1 centromere protein H [Salvelinus namaycush]XP_038869568.1 centromere protein H [Salvelinus namaycush]